MKAVKWRRSEEAGGGGLRKPKVVGATKGESGKKLQRRLCDYHKSKT